MAGTSPRLTARNELACAWVTAISLLFTILGFAVLAGYVPPPHANDTAAEIARFYADDSTRIRLGLVVLFMSWTGWAALIAGLASQCNRVEGRSAVTTWLLVMGGCAGWACLMIPTMILGAASFRPERSVEVTQTLHDLGWITAFMPVPPFAVMAIALAVLTFQDSGAKTVYPRWFAYANIWACVLFMPGAVLICFKDGPLAYHGFLVFWIPLTVFFAWILMLAVMVRRAAVNELRAAPHTSDTVSEQTVALAR